VGDWTYEVRALQIAKNGGSAFSNSNRLSQRGKDWDDFLGALWVSFAFLKMSVERVGCGDGVALSLGMLPEWNLVGRLAHYWLQMGTPTLSKNSKPG